MMLSPDTTNQQKQRLEIIASQGHRAKQLVRQLLDFSQQRTTTRAALYVTALATEVAGLMEQTVPESIKIRWVCANDGFARTRANVTQIQETITNLVVNTRDAMPDGRTITISVKRVEVPEVAQLVTPATEGSDLSPTGGTWVPIVVQDVGSGMQRDVI